MEAMIATRIVHWPGKDALACELHYHRLVGAAAAMGFNLSATNLDPDRDPEIECANCANEKAKLFSYIHLCREPDRHKG
jgi:hypothetical protein